jgi:hypothetical protein
MEIQRISELCEKVKYKKRNIKKTLIEKNAQMDREMARLNKDIDYFRDKV